MNLPQGVAGLLAALPLPVAARNGLRRRLAAPGRYFHGLGHLALLWQRHRRFGRGGPASRPRASRLIAAAILFHDAILRPGATDNETCSATLWRQQARRLRSFSASEIAWVAATIEGSAGHLSSPSGRDAASRLRIWFLDLDLTPLGEPAPVFRRNGRALQAEARRLSATPDAASYDAAARRFLSTAAAAPAILRSPRLHTAFERQARANIRTALCRPRHGDPGMDQAEMVALWEAHCRAEFETHDLGATMATMVPDPSVNHVPTMTGGRGYDQVKRFYRYHFIGGSPPDTSLRPISRTIGQDQLVDEMIFTFTHTQEMDWMLPGIPPTGRRVEIPLVAIIGFRDGKVAFERIYWDQASVLVQLGRLNPAGLPVAGAETAHKVADNSLPSNALMAAWAGSAGKPL